MSRIETIGNATLYLGDCLDVLKTLPTNSVDSVVCDPPYGLSFMGKKWDYDVPSVEIWAECLRVLKPGGHLLAFAGTRTQHRMAVRIEDAGFEIRDMIAWVYGSGFPKSHNVGKSIDREAGAQREVVGKAVAGSAPLKRGHVNASGGGLSVGTERSPEYDITAPATEAAQQWQGWGTALKPALEPITMARKPLVGTVAANVLEHGTGALNIDGCRVAATDKTPAPVGVFVGSAIGPTGLRGERDGSADSLGRWPANLIHSGEPEVVAGFPQTGPSKAAPRGSVQRYDPADASAKRQKGGNEVRGIDDSGGSAARFFYCAKASKRDRDEGLEGFARSEAKSYEGGRIVSGDHPDTGMGGASVRANIHPTVKPTDLMAYLCRLVTPPGGVVLDPFMGSGSTGKAAVREGFRFVGCELSPEYLAIARARIEHEVAAIEAARAAAAPAPAPQLDLFVA